MRVRMQFGCVRVCARVRACVRTRACVRVACVRVRVRVCVHDQEDAVALAALGEERLGPARSPHVSLSRSLSLSLSSLCCVSV